MAIADILMSPAKVYHAPAGEALPSENSVAYGVAWGGNWVDVGYTVAPLTINFERSLYGLEVEQALTEVANIPDKESLTAETTLAELTAANLLVAFGGTLTQTPAGAAQVAKDEVEVGGTARATVYAWGFEGLYQTDAGAQFPVRFFVFRATATVNGNLEFSKKKEVGVPLQIKALADVGKVVGKQLFKWQRVTAPHT
jgi:hypothetical protein